MISKCKCGPPELPLLPIRAVLPLMMARRSGKVVAISGVFGLRGRRHHAAGCASKWALEGFSQSLAAEVERFGIHVTLIEPGGFSTDWSGASAKRTTELEAYDGLRADVARWRGERNAVPGNPEASAAAVLKIVDAENPPLRVFFGSAPLQIAKADYENRLRTWEEWQPVSELAQG